MANHHASDILALTQTQEYTAIASSILEAVLTHKTITTFAANLWQYLFNKAKFCKQLSITTAYSNLAKYFSVSERTIIRHMNLLEKNHFLIKKQNFHKQKGQLANTFYVSVPDDLLANARNKKTRHCNQTAIKHGDDRVVREEGDNLVIAKDKIKKEINNNNVVVPCDENNKKTDASIMQAKQTRNLVETKQDSQQKTEELNYLKEILSQKEQDFLAEKDTMKKFELNRQCGEIEAAIEILNHQINYQQQALALEQQTQQAQEKMVSNIHEMAHLPGPRVIPDRCFSRLKQKLHKMGYQDNQLNQMLNEIVQEARFGSLVKQQGNTEENSVEKAVNIGLKLVREGRWQSPKTLKTFMELQAQSKRETFFVEKHAPLSVGQYLGLR